MGNYQCNRCGQIITFTDPHKVFTTNKCPERGCTGWLKNLPDHEPEVVLYIRDDALAHWESNCLSYIQTAQSKANKITKKNILYVWESTLRELRDYLTLDVEEIT